MTISKSVLFVLIFSSGVVLAQETITLSEDYINREIELREEALLRPLNLREKETMVKNLVFDELLLHEALKLDLHLSDSEVRDRLIGIMEYTYQPRIPEPSEADLNKFYMDNKSDFDVAAKYSFDHLYYEYKPDVRVNDLDKNENWQELGDEYWVTAKVMNKALGEIKVFLGNEVTQTLKKADQNKWTGPIKSPVGYHFVRVTAYTEPMPRTYDEVSSLVLDLWKAAKRKEKFEERMFQLIKGYKVELPDRFKGLTVE